MAKLSKDQNKDLSKVGIEAKSQESARDILIKKLGENDVDDVENDSLEELIEMYAAFYEEPEEKQEVAHEEEKEYDEASKTSGKKAKKVAEPAAETKKVKKTVDKAPVKEKSVKKQKVSKRGEGWSNANEEHVELLEKIVSKAMKAIGFSKDDFENKILKQGCTVYMKMKSGKKALFGYDKLRVIEGEIVGSFFFQCLKGQEEVDNALGDVIEINGGDLELKNYNPHLIYATGINGKDLEKRRSSAL